MIRLLATMASAALLCAGGAGAQAPAKPDAAKGQAIAGQVCAACHANDGNSQMAANPKIAGQFYEYLHKQLVNFRSQGGKKPERDNAVMAGMIANLSADDLRNLAAYYAAQKLKPAAARDKDLAGAGPENLPGRQRGDRRGGLLRLPRSRGHRDADAVPAHCRAVPGVHRSAAQGVPGRRARQ